ncbi:MAG: type II secretion system protein GspL [Gammaproteobacteria bacterium]
MTTLYIRLPARADSERLLAAWAQVADGGAIAQSGEGALKSMGDIVATARQVILLLAAADVTLLQVKIPPLSGARLKAALPSLVEEQILGDPAECVLTAALADSPDGTRTIAVASRAYLEAIVKQLMGQGARKVSALPAQLCVPLAPGSASAVIDGAGITLRQGLSQGLGLGFEGDAASALQTVAMLAGDVPLTLYVPADAVGEYRVLAAEAGPAVTIEEEHWAHWVAGTRTTSLDLVPALGAAGARARDWQRWRWPIRLAIAAVVVNIIGLNVEYLRLKREAKATRESMTQTFRAAYPKETVVLDPEAQMRKNIALAKASHGQLNPDEFTYLAAAFGEAARGIGFAPSIATLTYAGRSLTIKFKDGAVAPEMLAQLQGPLSGRRIDLQDIGGGAWKLTSIGGKQ